MHQVTPEPGGHGKNADRDFQCCERQQEQRRSAQVRHERPRDLVIAVPERTPQQQMSELMHDKAGSDGTDQACEDLQGVHVSCLPVPAPARGSTGI